MSDPKPATRFTAEKNASMLNALPFDDTTDFDNAKHGLIAEASGQITNADGRIVWDFGQWSFLDGDVPDTVAAWISEPEENTPTQ